MNPNVSHMSTAFFVGSNQTLRFGLQTEECTHDKNSILCIEDVRKDGGTVAEENQLIKPKQKFVEYNFFLSVP